MSEPRLTKKVSVMTPELKSELLGLAIDIMTWILIGFATIAFKAELGATRAEAVLFVLCAWIWKRQNQK